MKDNSLLYAVIDWIERDEMLIILSELIEKLKEFGYDINQFEKASNSELRWLLRKIVEYYYAK